MKMRKSKSEAKKLAEQWVAIPGTSEHQLGIAVDINADTTKVQVMMFINGLRKCSYIWVYKALSLK